MPHSASNNILAVAIFALLATSTPSIASPRCDTCPRDSHGHIQRHASAKAAFKREHPCPATGKRSGACPRYVIDHKKPLCAHGLDIPENMQWQSIEDAKAKDQLERQECRNQ